MSLYIHIKTQDIQPHHPNNNGISAGTHAIFAFEIFRYPFAQFRQRAWNPMMGNHLLEAWDRQIHLIESLHLPAGNTVYDPVFELRFITRPPKNQVDLFFVVKVFAATVRQAREEALTLAQEMFCLCPYDFKFQPLTNRADFERAYQSDWLSNVNLPDEIVEIRRFERLVPLPAHTTGGSVLYLIQGWHWHMQSLDQLWYGMAKYHRRLMFSVSLVPLTWGQADYVYYNELRAVFEQGDIPVGLRPEFAASLRFYHELLFQTPRPFLQRLVLVGSPKAPRGLANAAGVGLCLPAAPVRIGPEEVGANFSLIWPQTNEERLLAKLNLLTVSQYDWGPGLVGDPLKRWRYAVNSRQAQAAFRIPIPPDSGYPGVLVGKEIL